MTRYRNEDKALKFNRTFEANCEIVNGVYYNLINK